eukprot:g6281.t1
MHQTSIFRNGRSSVPREFWNPYSRIGRAFLEFGYDESPFCILLLKHFIAAAIQAIWRGYILRKRFRHVIQKAKQSAADKQKTIVQKTWMKHTTVGQRVRESVMINKTKPYSWHLQDVVTGLKSMGEQQGAYKGKSHEETDSDWSDLDAEELQVLSDPAMDCMIEA